MAGKKIAKREIIVERVLFLILLAVLMVVAMVLLLIKCSKGNTLDNGDGHPVTENTTEAISETEETTEYATEEETTEATGSDGSVGISTGMQVSIEVSPGQQATEALTESGAGITTTVINAETTPRSAVGVTAITLSVNSLNLTIGSKQMPIVTMSPWNADNKAEKWTSSDESIAIVDGLGNITGISEGSCTITVTSVDNPMVSATVSVTVTKPAETQAPTTGDLYYKDGILIANKSHGLPADYAPGLSSELSAAFAVMQKAAAQEGLNIYISSGFRSYEYQSRIYNNYVNAYGQESADRFSARPGYSEHQTGLAIDLNSIDDSFANTPEYTWICKHAQEYGFIVRYPQGKESITGYKFESWHLRYLGVETATKVYNSGLTLEEYLGIDSHY